MEKYRKVAVPATRSSAALLRARRRMLIVLVLLACLAGPASLVTNLLSGDDAPPPVGDATPAKAIALAEEAGRDFLAGRATKVPVVDGLDPDWAPPSDGQSQVAAHPVTAFTYSGSAFYRLGETANTPVWRIRFRVSLLDNTYFLDVPVVEAGGDVGYILADTPALLPAATGATTYPQLNYNELYDTETPSSEAVKAAAESWAAAYADGGANSDALRKVTRDFSETRRYDALSGFRATSVTVKSTYATAGSGELNPAGVIAAVEVVLTPVAATGPDLRTTYDLYVETLDGETEWPVIAWGPAGSGIDLARHDNAITTN